MRASLGDSEGAQLQLRKGVLELLEERHRARLVVGWAIIFNLGPGHRAKGPGGGHAHQQAATLSATLWRCHIDDPCSMHKGCRLLTRYP